MRQYSSSSSSSYIDEIYLQGSSYQNCMNNVLITKQILLKLGFELSDKSVYQPTQSLAHLGFILDSRVMKVFLGKDKKDIINDMVDKALKQPVMTVRTLTKIIGTLVACFPVMEYGQPFYRKLEFIKIEALKVKYDYEQNITLTDQSKEELKWWTTEGINCGRHISHGNADEIIVTDASGHGWGAVYKGKHTQGLWTHSEAKKHINVLEMRAGLIGI